MLLLLTHKNMFSFPKIRRFHIHSKLLFYDNDVNKVFTQDKKLISISPGGFKGFYMMGICKYIKENYNLDKYIFSGASAGAWNSLLLCYKGDLNLIQDKIIDSSIQDAKKISDIENLIKTKILYTLNTSEFNLNRLFIGVTTFNHYKTNTTIFSGFDSLEDALNCCIASSHIPLVTGGFTNVYRDVLSFDGGFSRYPYLNTQKSVLHITPNIWKEREPNYVKKKSTSMTISDYTTLFSKDKFNFNEMIEQGYQDSKKNKEFLDKIFQCDE
jgi:hypothetical protein